MYHVQRNLGKYCAGIKRKTKDSDVSAEVLLILEQLDQRADARMEDREGKRMLLEAEVEEKREQERRHEQRMQSLMLGFFSTPLHILCQDAITPVTLLVTPFSTPLTLLHQSVICHKPHQQVNHPKLSHPYHIP